MLTPTFFKHGIKYRLRKNLKEMHYYLFVGEEGNQTLKQHGHNTENQRGRENFEINPREFISSQPAQ
jgi:hypothetical protein